MNAEQFIEKVRKMREHQIAYFAHRLQMDLFAAKQLEKEVDRALAEGVETMVVTSNLSSESGQLGLFEKDDKST